MYSNLPEPPGRNGISPLSVTALAGVSLQVARAAARREVPGRAGQPVERRRKGAATPWKLATARRSADKRARVLASAAMLSANLLRFNAKRAKHSQIGPL